MPRDDSGLESLEQWMYSVISHPQGAEAGVEANSKPGSEAAYDLEQTVLPSEKLTPLERISVYADMYFWRFIDIMSEEYPTVEHLLGVERFAQVVRDYITRHPSTYYNLNRLSVKFPQYLRNEADEIPHQPFVVAVATVERLMEDVFDAPHKEKISTEAIQNVPGEQWPEICLEFNPALYLLELDYPVNAYMTAVNEDRHMDAPKAQKSFVVVYRCNYRVWRDDLEYESYLLLAQLKEGKSLGEALENCALQEGVDMDKITTNLGEWFQQWTAQEFFCGLKTGS
ncbi:MAG: DNA-binding domain-containing protein [Gammaproteobacteria bacterium]|nr:DNA-binding domain-containing protein [Gammaproteobacteria bacterium]